MDRPPQRMMPWHPGFRGCPRRCQTRSARESSCWTGRTLLRQEACLPPRSPWTDSGSHLWHCWYWIFRWTRTGSLLGSVVIGQALSSMSRVPSHRLVWNYWSCSTLGCWEEPRFSFFNFNFYLHLIICRRLRCHYCQRRGCADTSKTQYHSLSCSPPAVQLACRAPPSSFELLHCYFPIQAWVENLHLHRLES